MHLSLGQICKASGLSQGAQTKHLSNARFTGLSYACFGFTSPRSLDHGSCCFFCVMPLMLLEEASGQLEQYDGTALDSSKPK